MKIGFIGLGKMGSRMVLKLLQDRHQVTVWNRSKDPIQDLQFKIQNSKFKHGLGRDNGVKVATTFIPMSQISRVCILHFEF